MDEVPKHIQRSLDAFLVDNHELEELSARLKRFNIFDVLKIVQVELRHSNMLAWLLDPNGSHGLGDAFVRRFLSRLIRDKEEIPIDLTPANIELMDLDDVEVLREWRNVDVLVLSRGGGWALLIENKIGSSESPGQLARYAKVVREETGIKDVIPVFLTLDGDNPSDEGQEVGFVPLSWVHILQLLERLVKQHESKIPSEARILLGHYLDTLRRLTMQDPELVDLCKRIYRKHKEAINLVVEYGAASQALDICERAVAALPDLAFPPIRTLNRVSFLPKAMDIPGLPPAQPWGPGGLQYPLLWWFHWDKKKGNLKLSLEGGPLVDPEARLRLMELSKEAGFKPGAEAFRKEAKYSRIQSETFPLKKDENGEPNENEDYLLPAINSMWETAWTKGIRIVDVLNKLSKSEFGAGSN